MSFFGPFFWVFNTCFFLTLARREWIHSKKNDLKISLEYLIAVLILLAIDINSEMAFFATDSEIIQSVSGDVSRFEYALSQSFPLFDQSKDRRFLAVFSSSCIVLAIAGILVKSHRLQKLIIFCLILAIGSLL